MRCYSCPCCSSGCLSFLSFFFLNSVIVTKPQRSFCFNKRIKLNAAFMKFLALYTKEAISATKCLSVAPRESSEISTEEELAKSPVRPRISHQSPPAHPRRSLVRRQKRGCFALCSLYGAQLVAWKMLYYISQLFFITNRENYFPCRCQVMENSVEIFRSFIIC